MVRAVTVTLALWLLAHPAWAAELTLPPGFTSQVYVTGHGFDRGGEGGAAGVPVMLTLAVDDRGMLYLARSGNRYGSSQSEDVLTRLYRIPPGGVRLSPASEPTYAWGPPLRNPDLGAVLAPGAMFVSTFDPDRQLGVVYRMVEGRPKLFAGGTPARGEPPLLVQPEGIAQDRAGHVYVADRARNVVVKLDAGGRVLDPQYLKITRARTLAVDEAGHVWAGGDGTAAQPWQEGVGQIWRVGPDGQAQMVFEGPNAAGIAAGPGGALFVTQRHTRKVVALTPDGRRLDVATLRGDAMPRGLAFAPDTPETRRAGIAGDLFVVSFVLRTWYLNEVVRITGPFAEWIRKGGVTE
jgi:sugar lactone lactonase YvrE